MTLATRVREQVDRIFGGSVNAAAKAWQVPQRTLARLVDGELAQPRADVLASIARGIGASIDWLVTGEGEGPPSTSPVGDPVYPEWIAWGANLDALHRAGLERDEEVSLIPFASRWAFIRIAEKLGGAVTKASLNAALVASRLEVSAWGALLAGLIREFGAEAVARALNQLRTEARLGFNGFAMKLAGEGKLRVDLDAAFEEYPPRISELRVQDDRGAPPDGTSGKRGGTRGGPRKARQRKPRRS